jgi:hypothetical protein
MKKIGLSVACIAAFVSMQVACSVSSDGAPPAGAGSIPGGDVAGSDGTGGAGDPGDPGAPASPGDPSAPSDPSDPMAPAPVPAPGKAMVRVVHGSADAPAVDVYVKGVATPVVTNIAYGQTSGWLEVDPGAYEFELRAAPSKPTDPIAYKTASLTIPAQAMITALAAGSLASTDADASFRVLPIVEAWGPMQKGDARVRVIHASPDAPAVGVDVGNDDPSSPEVPSLARFADTGAAGVALPAATALWVGVDAAGDRLTSFTTPKLPEGANVLVIATGFAGKAAHDPDGFALLAIGPSGTVGFIKQDPVVYALHASPDAPRVDAFAGGAELLDDLGFGEMRGPFQLQPGTYTLDFFGHAAGAARPAGEPAASSSTGALVAGERYLTIATGLLASPSKASAFRLATYEDEFSRASSAPKLRAIHASPDAPAVDIGVAGASSISPVLFADLKFGDASPGAGLAATAGHLPIGITPAGANATIVKRFTVPATDDQRAFVIAAGSLGGAGQSFRLIAVDTAKWPWSIAHILPH